MIENSAMSDLEQRERCNRASTSLRACQADIGALSEISSPCSAWRSPVRQRYLSQPSSFGSVCLPSQGGHFFDAPGSRRGGHTWQRRLEMTNADSAAKHTHRGGCLFCRHYRDMKCHHPDNSIPVDFVLARGHDYPCGPGASLWEWFGSEA